MLVALCTVAATRPRTTMVLAAIAAAIAAMPYLHGDPVSLPGYLLPRLAAAAIATAVGATATATWPGSWAKPPWAARADSFLGERYRRVARRRGAKKAIVAIGRSILVIVWHLLSDPRARYTDLGSDFFDRQINSGRRKRAHIHQLEALSYKVTLEPAA